MPRRCVLPVAEQPRAQSLTAYKLCVLNYVCFMIYLIHPCVENVVHAFLAPFRQYVLSAFVCLAARSTHSQSQISRDDGGGARRGAWHPVSLPASHAVRRFNRLSPRVEQESPTSVIAFRQAAAPRSPSPAIAWQFRCRRTFLNHK